MNSATKFKLSTLASVISSSLLFSTFIAKADEEKQVERIEITGSHIKRTDLEGPSPVATLTAEDIQKSGVTDLISLFTKLPISGQGTFSTQANSSDDTANGGSSVSLRGLGADSTLILINGRRVSVSPFAKGIDTSFVDINNIPLSAIKRVDILKDGASATYGSDAVAGVINIILRDDVEGAEVSAKFGTTADGGGDEQSVNLVFGNQTDNSSHTFILEYFNREEVLYADRDYSKTSNQALRTGDPDATDFRSSSGIPGTIALASDPSNRLIDLYGNDTCPEADRDFANNLCRYDYAPHMTMIPAAERFSWNYLGKYEINDNLRAFAELNGQNSKSTVRGAGSPSFNELTMAGDNINHPFANMPDHEFHGQDLTMRRRTVDIGNREKRVDSNYHRAILGLQGEFKDWNWEAAYSYIKSSSTERGVDGFPNKRRMQEAIDSGAYDPFEPSSNGQQVLDYVETTTTRIGKSTMKSLDFKASGSIFEMEHGDLMLAFGGEYREESISDNPDDQFLRGEVFGTEATQANGSRDNMSVFGEMSIPVLDSLEVQLAARYEDYSDFGDTTNPKVSFFWSPMDDLSLRGSWGTAFRAPSLHQLGLGRTDESPNLVDTLRCSAIGNQDRACEPQEYTAIFEGNPELGPEESESYNLGLIYNITENLNFSIDYYDYDITDIIGADTQFVMDTYGLDPNIVERRPTAIANDPGEVIQVNDSYQNIGDLQTSGIDLDVRYNLDTEVGQFKFGYVLNYVLNFEDYKGTKEGGFEQPQMRWTTSVDWVKDDFSATAALNYIDSFEQEASLNLNKDVDAMTTLDASVNYFGIEDLVLTVGATNLTNEEPPFAYHDFMGFVVNVHSGQGRFAYVQASYKF
ncbi:TonB-dependent receptor plug domain-containing protein [Pseudoalteromonas sp. G4]|uniref:TonB-dependent receptor plug domain-containing protein n=1 Tax=Pseudoalteromonas sp. G4 TaxID=2992761 RepID=UPI00237E68B1|nr:TonB-dependent receptor [Pseudoalteromonas sp. G4]MDE3271108.1 TonB-dependent receptor [Pseudoalteromonas sp. G4]